MKTLVWTFVLMVMVLAFLPSQSVGLTIGEKAPLFEASSTQGTIRLSDFQGKKVVVLAFYIKDFTPG